MRSGLSYTSYIGHQLVRAMQSDVSTAGADQDRGRTVEELERELAEAHRRKSATAEVLRVISSSPTDLQPVFDTIAASCNRLLGARSTVVLRLVGRQLKLAAFTPVNPAADEALHKFYPRLIDGNDAVSIVARERVPFIVSDIETDGRVKDAARELARGRGYRSLLIMPMLRQGETIGTINVSRVDPGSFSGDDLALLQTFADQAVIAIENTRLFEEVQAELRVALEQQTVTSELVKVIGRSTFELQPIFKALAENAVRLCSAERAFIFRFDGKVLRAVASYNASHALVSFIELNPIVPTRQTSTGRAALERRTIHIHDVLADPEYNYGARQVDPYRTMLAIPMLRADELLGVITIYRHEVNPFTDSQIALMETFADQAVIAIENARLFTELTGLA